MRDPHLEYDSHFRFNFNKTIFSDSRYLAASPRGGAAINKLIAEKCM